MEEDPYESPPQATEPTKPAEPSQDSGMRIVPRTLEEWAILAGIAACLTFVLLCFFYIEAAQRGKPIAILSSTMEPIVETIGGWGGGLLVGTLVGTLVYLLGVSGRFLYRQWRKRRPTHQNP